MRLLSRSCAGILSGGLVILAAQFAAAQLGRSPEPGTPESRFLPPDQTSRRWTLGVNATNTSTGVVITRVVAGSPAAAAGMEVGDRIVAVGRSRVGTVGGVDVELVDALLTEPDRRGRVTLLLVNRRTGRLVEVPVELAGGGAGPRPPLPDEPPLPGAREQIQKIFLTYLLREPKESEFVTWELHLRRGRPITDVQEWVLASRDFYSQADFDDTKFVRLLFQRVTGNKPSPSEYRTWTDLLKELDGDRTVLVRQFLKRELGGGVRAAPD
jgi:hypothetical protein